MKLLLKILILFYVILLSGCLKGTGSGNPLVGTPIDNDGSIRTVYGTQLRNNICLLILSCSTGLDINDCKTSIGELTTYAPKLGLTDALTFEEIIDEEYSENITANSDASELCDQGVSAFDCSDPEVINAYDNALANPYTNSDQLLIPACEDVFK